MAVFDGQMGYGQVVAREATQWAIGDGTRQRQRHLHLAPRSAYRSRR